MNALEKLVREEIAALGPMSVARYMQLALQHPEHGYYVKGDPLGRQGDFITAPEVSQMFGEMLGLFVAELWRLCGSPAPFALVELGPGRGTLMADALRATAKVEGFHKALKLYLLESNATLRDKQAAALAPFAPSWIEDLAQLPPCPLIVLANEFFDALPIQQYLRTQEGWRERRIAVRGDELVFVAGGVPLAFPLPEEVSFFEVSPQAIALMQEIAAAVKTRGGGALIVDYGSNAGAWEDTLQAVAGHASVDPLARTGEVDLTAHVDFAALALTAGKQGAKIFGPVPQGAFLQAMGIDLRAARLKHGAASGQGEEVDLALHKLTDSDQMGTLFKVMALTRSDISSLPGFP